MRKYIACLVVGFTLASVAALPLDAQADRECSEARYFDRAGARPQPVAEAVPTSQLEQFAEDPPPGEEAYRKEYRPSILREQERLSAVAAGESPEAEPGEAEDEASRQRAGRAGGAMRERP